MKTIKLIVLGLLITSCTKEWNCEITTTVGGNEQVGHYILKGDKDDKEAYELSGTKETSMYTQTTVCVPN